MVGLKEQLIFAQSEASLLREKCDDLGNDLQTAKEQGRLKLKRQRDENKESLRNQKTGHRDRMKKHDSEFRAAMAKKKASMNIIIL